MDQDTQTPSIAPRRVRKRVRPFFCLAAAVVILLFCSNLNSLLRLLGIGYTFPSPEEVASIHLYTYEGEGGPAASFEVSETHWGPIFESLSPSGFSLMTAGWPPLAKIEVRTKDRDIFRVDVYDVGYDSVGAFSVWKLIPRRDGEFSGGASYRGGSMGAFMEVMEAVANDADDEKEE